MAFSHAYTGEDVQELIEQEKKSAAVETLFTFALALLAIIQTRSVIFGTDTLYVIITTVPIIGLLVASGMIGLDNVEEVLKKEIAYFEDEWEHLDAR